MKQRIHQVALLSNVANGPDSTVTALQDDFVGVSASLESDLGVYHSSLQVESDDLGSPLGNSYRGIQGSCYHNHILD